MKSSSDKAPRPTTTLASAAAAAEETEASVIAVRRAAMPELLERLADIDALPEFAGTGKRTEEARILRKLDAYSAWLTRHSLHPPALGGWVSHLRVLDVIRHAAARKTKAIVEAMHKLQATHGLSVVNLRHNPERAIDRTMDEYQCRVIEREKGPPRMAANPEKICRISAAKDIPCSVRDLDKTSMSRLRAIAKLAPPGDLMELVGDERDVPGQRFNPAVAPLLRKALASYNGEFPADPLNPKQVDLIAVTWDAGVSISDVVRFEGNMKVIRDAVAKGKLVANPILKERRYTYKDLIDHGRARRTASPGNVQDAPAEASKSVAALNLFLDMPNVGGSRTDRVPHDFRQRVERALRAPPAKADSRWAKQMGRWIEWNMEMRVERPLPVQFGLALRILCAELGRTRNDLARSAGKAGTVSTWMRGQNIPSTAQGPLLEVLERELEVPSGSLSARLSDHWRQRRFDASHFALEEDLEHDDPEKLARQRRAIHSRHLPLEFTEWDPEERRTVLDEHHWDIVRQDTPTARRQADQMIDEYSLAEKDWPEAFRTAWRQMIPTGGKSPLRRLGEEHDAPDAAGARAARGRRDEWATATIKLREGLLGQMIGYFVRSRELPADPKPWQPRMTDFSPEAGLGIPFHLVGPVLFAIPDLVSSFCWWKSRRSGGLGKMLPQYVALASEFVRPKTGGVWKDEKELAKLKLFKEWWDAHPHTLADGPIKLDIEPFEEGNWQPAVAKAHERLRADYARLLRGKLPKTRDPFLAVATFVDSKLPMIRYMKGIRNVLADTPPSIASRHTHSRDCVMALIEVQTALRAKNMMMRISGPNRTLFKVETEEDGEVWRILIPASQFKNRESPYFADDKPYQFDLANEDNLYERLDQYINQARRYLLAARSSDALFINNLGKEMNARHISAAWRRMVQLYFVHNTHTGRGTVKGAMPHGIHSVRHISATHIVRVTGDLFLAAYAIQDDIKTAIRYYARFIPEEKARMAAQVLAAARRGEAWVPRDSVTQALAA